MSAIDKIAELHCEVNGGAFRSLCGHCGDYWPCTTRDLCDEAAQELATQLQWKADAARLAAAVNFATAHSAGMYPLALDALTAAQVAHDALVDGEG